MAGWASLEELILMEVTQRREEGCDTSGFPEKITACKSDPDKLMAVYRELCALPIQADFPYREPNELEEILALSEQGKLKVKTLPQKILADKMEGAWLGRCVGCALGKPLEWDPYVGGTKDAFGYVHIRRWLEGADAYPLRDYVPGHSQAEADGLSVGWPDSQRENIRFMETDDDIRYLVLGLMMSERFGNDFTPDQVSWMWRNYLPADLCCTAERQAYVNCLNAEISDQKARWEYIRTYLNPYREWIGAQIRADHYGYANAGDPLTAAKTAYQDAAFSHTKNGIYGSMFIAAVIAAAFVESDITKCVEAGLSVIPTTSRLHQDIRTAIALGKSADSQEDLFDALWKTFGHYNWVHTNNNAAAVAAVLVYADGDFSKAVTTAVSCGWDTDCNGATVGSVMGAFCGAGKLPEHWTQPLHDTLYSFIPGFHPISIQECANRSLAVWNTIHKKV